MSFQSIGPVRNFPDGQPVEVRLGARRVAVYRLGDDWYALKNICPHEGDLLHRRPPRDGQAVCANHGWRFDLKTGHCTHGNRQARVAVYPVEVKDDTVWIDVES